MLRHYLKVFFYNLFRQKVITLINILGLAIGMAVFILISLYVVEEYSYEKRWEKADRIVRTVSTLKFNADNVFEMDGGSPKTLEKFKEFFPEEIETGTRVFSTGQSMVIDQEEMEGSVNYVDAAILDVFNFEEVSGSLAETLAAPGRIALEEERARTLFSGEALGRSLTLRLNDGTERDFEVSAIYRLPEGKGLLEFPTLTLLQEELLPNFKGTENDWLSGVTVTTYLLLHEFDDFERINARADAFVEQYVRLPFMFGEDTAITESFSIRTQPVRDIYFNSLMTEEGGSRLMAKSFALVGVLVLLVATVNFVILSVARGIERVHEVGVRKTNGAHRLQLQFQFLLEALCQVVLAFLIALALYEVSVPLFESLMQTELVTQVFSLQYLFWGLLLIGVVTLLGGMYPAFALASFKPEWALKAGRGASAGNVVLKNVLVSFQFTIAVGLIIATLVIYQQLLYVQQRDAGFDADNVVSLVLSTNTTDRNATALINEISRIQGVSLVTPASRTAGRIRGSGVMTVSNLSRERGSNVEVSLPVNWVGYDFFSLYGIDIVAGRSFTREQDALSDGSASSETETSSYNIGLILNESAVRDLGFASVHEAVGKLLYLYLPYRNEDGVLEYTQHEIIGVAADSQFDSLRNTPVSELYRLIGNVTGSITQLYSFRVEESAMSGVRDKLENVWDEVMGTNRPMIFFGRDLLAMTFRQEENEGRLLTAFSLLAILVSCMGLYGLVAFDTSRRTKEIGIRKVLGGHHANIQFLFLRQYFWPMLAANIIAWPIAIWAMQKWLERFPYQIEAWLLIPICLIAGLMVSVIAGSTLGLTVLRAFRSKPAQSLRYE